MYIDNKIIFVAGAAGLAGSAIVQKLIGSSPTVRIRAAFRSDKGHFIDDPRVAYEHADLRNAHDCARLAQGCDAAVLAAAITGGAKQVAEQPWQLITDNVVLNARLLEGVCQAGVRRVIYISTSTVYQEYAGFIQEDQLDWNIDPEPAHFGTAWVNRHAEKLCQFWSLRAGVECLVARASNIFGPFGKFDPRTSNFIPALIRKAASRMDPFEVWGHPDITRDVIFSEDFAEAIVAMLNATTAPFDVFNVGTNRLTRIGEVVEWVLRHAGHHPRQVAWLPQEPTSSRFRALDCTKLTAATGWRARTDIEEGVARTVRWWQANQSTWTR